MPTTQTCALTGIEPATCHFAGTTPNPLSQGCVLSHVVTTHSPFSSFLRQKFGLLI